LGLFAATIAIQLIPLPPAVWTNLPGRAELARAAVGAGLLLSWRPISLTPDLTLNSLLSLVPPLAALIAVAGLKSGEHRTVVHVLLLGVISSTVLGIAQLAGGDGGGAYLYAVRRPDPASGLFANRNHNAAFLAIGLLCLGHWASEGARRRLVPGGRLMVAAGVGLLLILMIVATGSRSGTVIALPALLAAFLIAFPKVTPHSPRTRIALVLVPALVLGGAIMVAIAAGRGASLDRIAGFDADSENRLRNFPVLVDMLRSFLPVGIGFGAFDPAFRWFEPDRLLHPQVFNHAHNDWLELLLTGGIPSALVLLAFLAWAGRAIWRIGRDRDGHGAFAVTGAGVVLILGAASVSDYPLRTPILAVVFAIACAWISMSATEQPEEGSGARERRLRSRT
jgi:O-antigen ligase